jgi:hypothetical protein
MFSSVLTFLITHNYVGQLWTSHQPLEDASTYTEHTRIN